MFGLETPEETLIHGNMLVLTHLMTHSIGIIRKLFHIFIPYCLREIIINFLLFSSVSWEEMAHIDLLASIDYILNVTAQEKLTYVGHSLGSTLFFMAMAAQTEYNAKIELMIGMGPSSNMHHMKNTLVQVLAPLDYLIEE